MLNSKVGTAWLEGAKRLNMGSFLKSLIKCKDIFVLMRKEETIEILPFMQEKFQNEEKREKEGSSLFKSVY